MADNDPAGPPVVGLILTGFAVAMYVDGKTEGAIVALGFLVVLTLGFYAIQKL